MRLLRLGAVRSIPRTIKTKFVRRGIILMYHRVAEQDVDPWYLCVNPGRFAEHMEVLRKHTTPISLMQLARSHQEGKIPDRSVIITFDDGYVDNLHNAKPILQRYDIPATVFVIGDGVGKRKEFWWDELDRALLRPGILPDKLRLTDDGINRTWELGPARAYSDEEHRRDSERGQKQSHRIGFYYSVWELLRSLSRDTRRRMLDEILGWAGDDMNPRAANLPLTHDEVRTLAEGGLVDIGAHTMTHEMLSARPVVTQHDEIHHSKTFLEGLLNRPVTTFSYPFGKYTDETVSLVREAGFACACSVVKDLVWRESDRFLLPRFAVNNWSGQQFEQKLSRWLRGRTD